MPGPSKRYTAAFKADAVELFRTSGKSIKVVARDLGVNPESLRHWVHQADVDAGNGRGELTTAEREELRRLRRETRVLQMEREILKKAAAFFAKETR
jgi:transposase